MRIRMFGRLGDVAGREFAFEGMAGTVAELRRALAQRHPALADDLLGSFVRACVADTLVADDHPLADGDEVEFFPPLSGG